MGPLGGGGDKEGCVKESVGIMVWAQNYVDLTLKDLVFDAHIRFPASSRQHLIPANAAISMGNILGVPPFEACLLSTVIGNWMK